MGWDKGCPAQGAAGADGLCLFWWLWKVLYHVVLQREIPALSPRLEKTRENPSCS